MTRTVLILCALLFVACGESVDLAEHRLEEARLDGEREAYQAKRKEIARVERIETAATLKLELEDPCYSSFDRSGRLESVGCFSTDTAYCYYVGVGLSCVPRRSEP